MKLPNILTCALLLFAACDAAEPETEPRIHAVDADGDEIDPDQLSVQVVAAVHEFMDGLDTVTFRRQGGACSHTVDCGSHYMSCSSPNGVCGATSGSVAGCGATEDGVAYFAFCNGTTFSVEQ